MSDLKPNSTQKLIQNLKTHSKFDNSLKIWKLTQNLKTPSNFENSLKLLLFWWSRFKRILIRQNQAWQKRKQNTDKSITIKDTNKGRITVNKKKVVHKLPTQVVKSTYWRGRMTQTPQFFKTLVFSPVKHCYCESTKRLVSWC